MRQGKVYQVNTPAAFSVKPTGFEEFLIRMVEALGITKDSMISKRRN